MYLKVSMKAPVVNRLEERLYSWVSRSGTNRDQGGEGRTRPESSHFMFAALQTRLHLEPKDSHLLNEG